MQAERFEAGAGRDIVLLHHQPLIPGDRGHGEPAGDAGHGLADRIGDLGERAVAGHLWVALKHEITYRRPAFLDDNVVAQGVAEGMQGARAFFHTLIKRGEEVLAEVKSSWCCLDAATQRPARLARDVVKRFVGEKKAE